jgi:hypothetical protein
MRIRILEKKKIVHLKQVSGVQRVGRVLLETYRQ